MFWTSEDLFVSFFFQERFDESLKHFSECLRIKSSFFPQEQISIGETLKKLGVFYEAIGDRQNAVENFRRAKDIFQRNPSENEETILFLENRIRRISPNEN